MLNPSCGAPHALTNCGEQWAMVKLERFVEIGLKQDHALLANEIARFNRLFDQMEAVKEEVAARRSKEGPVFSL